jgi:hypothetical protein
MKKLLTTAVATLVAYGGTQVFAQNAKEGVITFSLSLQGQASVSTVANRANNGVWEDNGGLGPLFYKTGKSKLATADILHIIGNTLHKSPGFYSSSAALTLVQGELSGFFNIGTDLAAESFPDKPNDGYAATTFTSTVDDLSVRLANGRHFIPNPNTGTWPPGHHQPWGQIFVRDAAKGVCDNATFFFSLTVEECYDCFYLSSFISDASFKLTSGSVVGPPCCGTSSSLGGSGKDLYYLTLTFDATSNNPYLNSANGAYVGYEGGLYPGIEPEDFINGLLPSDGLTPDFIAYFSSIASQAAKFDPLVMRFTLNGIVTYQWSLKFINSSDLLPDFIGKASYAANGYGFINLVCQLITGSVSITEKSVKIANTCQVIPNSAIPWYDNWYGTGWNQVQDPWDTFSPTTTPTGFGSPINTPVDLSFHFGFDEEYEPGEQWGSNPVEDTPVPTHDGTRTTFIPVGP